MIQRPRLRALEGGASKIQAEVAPLASEQELLDGIIRGDERIAADLYRRLLPAVEMTLVRVFGRREPEHEDLIQIVFEQIILTLAKQSYAQACSLKTWASSIAARVALKTLRNRYRQRKVFDLGAEPEVVDSQRSPQDVERDVASRLRVQRLREELSRLAPPKAEAVVLHDVLGHGLLEIAAMTGTSVTAAQTRLSRGRRELAARLGIDAEDGGSET